MDKPLEIVNPTHLSCRIADSIKGGISQLITFLGANVTGTIFWGWVTMPKFHITGKTSTKLGWLIYFAVRQKEIGAHWSCPLTVWYMVEVTESLLNCSVLLKISRDNVNRTLVGHWTNFSDSQIAFCCPLSGSNQHCDINRIASWHIFREIP